MAKYLDLAGTTHLWDKICAKIESETSSLYETINLTVTDPLGGGLNDCNGYL